jgi:hypothetical protein
LRREVTAIDAVSMPEKALFLPALPTRELHRPFGL